MRRFRLSTFMLMIAIVALVIGLIIQQDRSNRRIAELEAVAGPCWKLISENRIYETKIKRLNQRVKELESIVGKDH